MTLSRRRAGKHSETDEFRLQPKSRKALQDRQDRQGRLISLSLSIDRQNGRGQEDTLL